MIRAGPRWGPEVAPVASLGWFGPGRSPFSGGERGGPVVELAAPPVASPGAPGGGIWDPEHWLGRVGWLVGVGDGLVARAGSQGSPEGLAVSALLGDVDVVEHEAVEAAFEQSGYEGVESAGPSGGYRSSGRHDADGHVGAGEGSEGVEHLAALGVGLLHHVPAGNALRGEEA